MNPDQVVFVFDKSIIPTHITKPIFKTPAESMIDSRPTRKDNACEEIIDDFLKHLSRSSGGFEQPWRHVQRTGMQSIFHARGTRGPSILSAGDQRRPGTPAGQSSTLKAKAAENYEFFRRRFALCKWIDYSVSTPIDRAVPAMIFLACPIS